MSRILLLRLISGIIGWMNPMDWISSLFILIYSFIYMVWPNQAWTKVESLFGVQDEIKAHQLENELFSLSPSSFDSIEGLFTKSKPLFLFLKQCWIEKKDYQLILSILSKLGLEYLVFVSTFHATRLAISNWKMPSLSKFFDSLTKEQDKFFDSFTKINKHD